MAWDSSRPVPWQRLIREWLIYVAIMVVIIFVAVQPRAGLERLRVSLSADLRILLLVPCLQNLGTAVTVCGEQPETVYS